MPLMLMVCMKILVMINDNITYMGSLKSVSSLSGALLVPNIGRLAGL